jgi:hypothetical protein
MMTFGSKSKIVRVAFAASLGVAVLIGCAGTAARAADDEEQESIDTKIVGGFLKALGLKRDDGSDIDYRERSPLVLPTGKTLPPPEPKSATAKTAGWPDDPDVKEAKRRKKAERDRKPYVEGVDDRPLLPNEYGTGTQASRGTSGTSGTTTDETSKPSSLKELGSKNIFSRIWAPKEEYTTFAGEPPRQSLIDPPPGYRTPSPSQPYGVGQEKWKPTAVDRQEPVK